ncbi:MAG TPA: tetratricopeptide repeat protein [Gemmataceae bacterium]|nr:tetratricopeptide repeat protein [Gemmataceae bacterium]
MALVGVLFWHACHRNPNAAFLSRQSPADWIVYAAAPDLGIQVDGPRQTVFRRRFAIAQPPAEVRLTVRAMTQFAVAVNGVEVAASEPSGSWKDPQTTSISGDLLAPGENELVATVTCEHGPPALWLVLDLDSTTVLSGDGWDASLLGAETRPVRSAAAAMQFDKGGFLANAEQPLEAIGKTWPICLAFAILTATLTGVANRRWPSVAKSPEAAWRLATAAIAGAWLILLISNWRTLHFAMGYDSGLHLDYIEYVRRHGRLPLGNEGMEMWQPPLYYVSAAMLTSIAGASPRSESGIFILRVFSYVLSLGQLLFVAGCLRRVYPNRSMAQLIGICFAGCLPVQIYLMHYNSNDVLAGAVSTAAAYFAIRVIQERNGRLGDAVVLGACLGAAVLSKLSAWPVVLVVFFVLFWQLVVERNSIGQWNRRLLLPAAVCALVCGWYFVRNYLNFGQVLPPDQAAFKYWQDPGCTTVEQFVRFGRALCQPNLSSFAGLPDGVYATLWGDGGWGGRMLRDSRPPWNYELMAAGYLLALSPTLLIGAGGAAIAWQVARGWKPEKLLMLGVCAASFCGMSYFYLQHPSYGAVKAHYALPSIVSLCVFAAEGHLLLVRGIAWRRWALSALWGAWALTSLASYAVDGTSSTARAWVAREFAVQGDPEEALITIQHAISSDPHDPKLRLTAGRLLLHARRPEEARQELAIAVEADPQDAEAQCVLANVLGTLGYHEVESRLLRNALQIAPDNSGALTELATVHLAAGDGKAAVEAARAGLRVSPTSPLLHLLLAQGLAQLGDIEQALQHQQIALEWKQRRIREAVADPAVEREQQP